MKYIKICPTCKFKNNPDSMMCTKCMGDISGVVPECADIEKKNKIHKSKVAKNYIVLIDKNKNKVLVKNGDVIGRKNIGSEILNEVKTVSRKHVKFIFEDNKWFIQDLNSTNETYLNDVKLNPGEKKQVFNRDIVNLSLATKFWIFTVEK